MRRLVVLTALVTAVACGSPAAPKTVPSGHHGAPRPAAQSDPESYWSEVPFDVASSEDPVEPQPKPDLDVARLVTPAQRARFDALPREVQARLENRLVAAAPRASHTASFGETYSELRGAHVPFVVTLDALFAITFGAIDRALEEGDRDVVAPALGTLLAKVDARLSAEARAARSDTLDAYTLARAVVGVARRLMDPRAELARPVEPLANQELDRILAHAGPFASPLLGARLDYSAFDAQAGIVGTDGRIGTFRALAWLAQAPLALTATKDVGEQRARTQTRAAMLLTRALGDPEAARAFARIDELGSFAAGASDQARPAMLLRAVATAGGELQHESDLVNVVVVDRVRRALAAESTQLRGGPAFHFFGQSTPPDARALFLFGVAQPTSLPAGLAAAVVLGAPGARTLLALDDASTKAADESAKLLPADLTSRHGSLYASGLDAIASYSTPSIAVVPWIRPDARQELVLESVLSAWTELRHASVPFAHAPARALMDENAARAELPAVGAVEPHPETIARLLALVRQAATGLAGHHALQEGGPAAQLLEKVDALLGDALRVATGQTHGLSPSDLRVVDEMPARIEAIERRMGSGAGAPSIVTVHDELVTGRALQVGTGYLDDVWMVLDVGNAPLLAIGARVPHYEIVSTLRVTDVAWARRLQGAPPPHPSWLAAESVR